MLFEVSGFYEEILFMGFMGKASVRSLSGEHLYELDKVYGLE